MKAKIQDTVTREINVDVPSWWKKNEGATTNYYALMDDEKYDMVAVPNEGYEIVIFLYHFSSSALNFGELDLSTKEEYEKAKATFIKTITNG